MRLKKSNNFELFLNEIDLVNDYSIRKFNKEFVFYEILFNGTVQNFINIMKNKKYNLNTQKKIWMIGYGGNIQFMRHLQVIELLIGFGAHQKSILQKNSIFY